MSSDSRLVGELLVKRKVLSRDALEEALLRAEQSGTPFDELILRDGVVGERDLTAARAEYQGIAAWNPLDQPIPPMVRGMLPKDMARKFQAIAVGTDEDQLVVALVDPSDTGALDQIAQQTGWRIRPASATEADVAGALDELYGVDPDDKVGTAVVTAPARLHLNDILTRMIEVGASDLHLSNGLEPSVRIDGIISALEGYPVLTGSELRELIYGILADRQRERFEAELELDTSHSIPGVGRFRVNVFLQRDSVAAVVRAIPHTVIPLDRLGLPPIVEELTSLPRGLVLVTGVTGSGKSTTLASMIDVVNSTRSVHILTVEDPIEFLHQHKRAVINQREVGEDTRSFSEALRRAMRQDPDVIMVGELRDQDTVATALTAAETGHLVFGTLHTQDAPQSVDRIIDVFPAHQQQQIRVQLASALQAVITQQLLRRSGPGRAVASEILVATSAVRNLIREGKIHQIYSVMQSGAQYGMRTMDHSLAELVRSNQISMDVATHHCHNPADLTRLVGGR